MESGVRHFGAAPPKVLMLVLKQAIAWTKRASYELYGKFR